MSYHVYTTDGIILKRTNFGEANVLLYVLTKDLGLILASAQSARLSVSKLSPSLQEYSYVSLTCIKGKNGWKVTNVMERQNFFFTASPYAGIGMAHIVTLLIKMIPGESAHPEIFNSVLSGFQHVVSVEKKDIDCFEIILILRILFELGYVVKNIDTENFLDSFGWDNDLFIQARGNKTVLVGIINTSISSSHL